jgi:hypothetical protein
MNKIVTAIGLVSVGAAVFGAVSTIGNRLYDKLEADYAKTANDNWSKAWDMAYKHGKEEVYCDVDTAARNDWVLTIEPFEGYKKKVKVTYVDEEK